ncbi:MAG: terpene cyclase/mutase family protein [Planctomycetaceae bacterium]|nr:terpene cyclase/mutase family protein [Planctomycetaceae bacterium]
MRNAPPWLLSLLVHLVLLIVLGLQMLPEILDSPLMLEVVYAEKLGEQLDAAVLESAAELVPDIAEPVLSEDLMPVDDPLAAPPDITPVDITTTQSSNIDAPSIGMALSGREKGMKKALLAAYGGTETTESAVMNGLEWLKRNQGRDGMWSLTGNYSQGAPTENREAATAMALLAFQGHGSTHKFGPYQAVVARGWNALIKKQDDEGNFFFTGGFHHNLYTHAQATIALCELYGMTRDETLKAPAEKALSYCLSSQSPQGGWRYLPGGASDTSVTGWFVMALQSGRMAGLTVPIANLNRISGYLDTATTDAGIRYAYQPGQSDTLAMTAEGLLCRQYLGWQQTDPRLVQGLDYLVRNPIRFADMDVYYWYYCTQAMHHMGGDHWRAWNSVMRKSIPAEQLKTGNERGSWAPSRDRQGHLGGRLYTTCLCIYMLEVYYRHLPIYKHGSN